MNVMLDEPSILTAVQAHPSICTEVVWGKRLATLPSAQRWCGASDWPPFHLHRGGAGQATGHPSICTEVVWGKRPAPLIVDLRGADRRLLADLLRDAWEGKAPARLVEDL
jgi:hypothetical protein